MEQPLYPVGTQEISQKRKDLAPETLGATEQEIMEAIWVAAEMRAGGAVAHSTLAIDAMSQNEARLGT